MDWFILAIKVSNPFAVALVAILLFLVSAVAFFYFGVRSYQNKKTIEITPTSKANAVVPGLVELSGIAKAVDSNLCSPIFGKECVYYRIIIEKLIKGKSAHWKEYEYARRESSPRFLLRDDSGLILIDSSGADNKLTYQEYSERGTPETLSEPCKKYLEETLKNPQSESMKYLSFWPSEDYRITETIIEPGHKLYVLGTAKIPDFQLPPGLTSDMYICKGDGNAFIIAESSEKNAIGSSNTGMLIGAGGAVGMILSVFYALVSGQAVMSIIMFFMMLVLLALVFAAPSFLKKIAEKPPEMPKNP
ncbi:MAG: GIDE domain-containing protein [Candidatus Micrarchaeota archaeon]|nr:GIDE domain-containing protein [Candidatus Micrarchaeota archaeon]